MMGKSLIRLEYITHEKEEKKSYNGRESTVYEPFMENHAGTIKYKWKGCWERLTNSCLGGH